ncbi:hypothetical protein [Hymenobacter rubripertinctus]|uniref:Uncharacterized protein n=1 Tax=Hymenobacter rubripertinctus TaxID=2029981 RepID=A0A418QYI5_9BACT|nr:hypothetical protein [Hymenobacter rubripertinctus]RIY10225.1 hypothetical protein D0T11_10250 [Hymenobacter rubripertinctus]
MSEPDTTLGHKILGFFIKDAPAPAGSPPPGAAVATPAAARPTGAVDSRFSEHLASVLAKHNLPGPDYFEFRDALRGLGGLDLSETKQFQAAWASFKALGGSADVNQLVSTANQYLNVLGEDRTGFIKSVEAAIAERVGGLQQEQQQLQADTEALTQQLAEIQQKLAANAARLTAIGGEVTEQSDKLNQNRQNYEATYEHFTQQIKNDIARISQHLT